MSNTHFGKRIRNNKTNLLSKDVYMPTEVEIDAYKKKYNRTDEQVRKYLLAVELNFELNMNCYASLDRNDFEVHLKKQIAKFHLKECTDLKEVDSVTGVYVMVLDEYKQVYVGETVNIKQRINQHWNTRFPMLRLLLGDICSSIIAIDSFGQLDTTRIFYLPIPKESRNYNRYTMEATILNSFDPKYTINRIRYDDKHKKDFSTFMDTEKLIARLQGTEHRSFSHFLEKYPIIRNEFFKMNPELSMDKLDLKVWE